MTHTNLKTRVVGVDIEKETTTLAVVDIRGNILVKESFKNGRWIQRIWKLFKRFRSDRI